ncbi:hypothetical protein L1987_50807 [Smallanthus sonchifolius]|uniref:Uncharacterized protein n=1 Tax=Smallanthus sonchifolius TaxID=185202 RepID=A0ACB9ENJ9_9ASTR|nr:hypothetical protein L1987_50807 [Smallanthus sonchifolius]
MDPSSLTSNKEGSQGYQALYDGLQADAMPKHVTLFLDGASRGQLKDIARICCDLKIKVLSVFTFSSGKDYQNLLMSKHEEIHDVATNIMKLDLEDLSRVSVIGKRTVIPDSLLEIIRDVEETTKKNKSLQIIEAIDYTGRGDIIQACMALAEKVEHGLIQPDDVDENVFQQELETKCSEFPNPDLMIRTDGKYSIDNFMLWQMAYAELYFVEKDDFGFNKTKFIEALDAYQKRSRRFGGK